MKHCYLLALLAAVLYSTGAKPTESDVPIYEDDEADYGGANYEEVDPRENQNFDDDTIDEDTDRRITFLSKPLELRPQEHDTIFLPCAVVAGVDDVQIWKKDRTVIFQSGISMVENPRRTILDNGTLQIKDFHKEDYGEYSCEFIVNDQYKPMLTHRVLNPEQPVIVALMTADNRTDYKPEETITITCKATGKPKPVISWYKGAEQADKLAIQGEQLQISNVKRKDSGEYRCLADNGIGKPDHGNITIRVQHKPSLSIEKYVVNSDKEMDAELKCSVTAHPSAIHGWQRNGQNVQSNEPHITIHRDQHEVTLVVKKLEESDFGVYTCFARNFLGKVEKNATIVRTPAIHTPLNKVKDNKHIVLTWKMQSKSPISQHEVQYRKKGTENWIVIKPDVISSNNDIYSINYALKGLENGVYEARVRSQNSHGWSEYSDITDFDGGSNKHKVHNKHNNKMHKDREQDKQSTSMKVDEDVPAEHQENDGKESSVRASQTGGSTSLLASTSSTLATLVLSLSLLFVNRQ